MRQREIRRRRAVALGSIVALGIVIALAIKGSGGTSALTPSAVRARGSPSKAASAQGPSAVSDQLLASTSYVSVGGKAQREIALTFDDGPGPYTRRILEVLGRLHTPATFFWIGRGVSEYRSVAALEVRAGYAIGNHTQTHASLGGQSLGDQRREIAQGAGAVESLGLARPRLFRPPYGSFDQTTLSLLSEQRMVMVLWTVDTRDFSSPGTKRIIYLAVSGSRPGAIILMHDGGGDRHQTLGALPTIIRSLRARRYKLVTVAQLLRDDPPPLNQPAPHSLAGG